MELAALARLLQFAAAAGLVGGGVYRQSGLARLSALVLLPAALLSLASQTAIMTGVTLAELDMPSVTLVLGKTQWGNAMAVRLALAVVALAAAFAWRPRIVAALGGLILVSFAFTGHGAAGGMPQLVADVLHLFAAGVWIGALFAFLILSARGDRETLAPALAGFAGIGSAAVAILIGTGLVNGWILVGPENLAASLGTEYGRLLAFKLVLFVGMLGLAALNRFRLTPALAAGAGALPALRRSLLVETALGVGVLALVAVLGLMEPVSAM